MATVDVIANRSTASEILGKAYFETDTNSFIVYNGSGWVELQSDGTGAAAAYSLYSLNFDGSTDFIDTGSTFESTYQSSHTISFWFKLDNTSGLQSLFGAWSGPTSQNAIYFDGSANITHRYRVASDPKSTLSASFTPDTNWHHYAVTLTQDGSNLDVKAYLDGVYKSTVSNAITMSGFSQSLNSYIGLRNGSTGYLDGKMDDVAIFGSALSDGGVSTGQSAEGDIANLYNNGVPGELPVSAVAHYRMGDDSNDSPVDGASVSGIQDSSGNGNHATQSTASNQPTFSTEVPE